MNKDDCKKLYDLLIYNNKNFIPTEELKKYWSMELSQYEANDVFDRAKDLLQNDKTFINNPNVYQLTSCLTKKLEKVDYSQMVHYCRNCKRPFNDYQQLKKHEERCNSVMYILRQYERFNWGNTPIKRDLYNMSDEEFNEKYNKLLRLVQKCTTDENEKIIIGFIFNPPSSEDAKKFLGGIT